MIVSRALSRIGFGRAAFCRTFGAGLRRSPVRPGSALAPQIYQSTGAAALGAPRRGFSTEADLEKEIEEKLKKTIEAEKILIFMKGTPEDPQCKYSAKMINILDNYKLNDYAYINVFSHELLRKCVKNVSNWPTFPQLYIRGKLVGGCDIVDELHNSGELEKLF